MREFSRRTSAEFVAFKQVAEAALEANPGLLRLDCLNPVKAIPRVFDFSLVPDIDLESAWRRFLNVRFDACVFSLGVRDSLGRIFEFLKADGLEVDLPGDVYPVYQMMAREAGLTFHTYPTLPTYDASAFRTDVALVTAPCVPSGRDLSADEVESMSAWLAGSGRRLLIIDRVYDFDNSAVVQPLIDTGRAIVCYSLSKTFLSPLVAGLTVVPPSLASRLGGPGPDDEGKAKVFLSRYPDTPRTQQDIFRYRWGRLKELLGAGFEPPDTGYLAVVSESHEALLARGILAVPGPVFGTNDGRSVVTCLHETNARGDLAEVERFHVTVLSNFARGFDKYSRTYDKAGIPESSFPDQFFLLDGDLGAGFAKARRLLGKTAVGDKSVVLRTRVKNHELRPNTRTGVGCYVERGWIGVDAVLDENLRVIAVEDAYADSLALGRLLPWSKVRPRSLSVLPIANACQARCAFCFSRSSLSEEQRQGKILLGRLEEACALSASLGAGRLVITGGGEPTLLAHARLLEIMRVGRRHFDKVVMITNGHILGNATEADRRVLLADYESAGLTVLSISRHSHDANDAIMKLDTRSERVAETWREIGSSLTLRWVCVLQRQGVSDESTLAAYLDWAARTGVEEVCFKELYVAATAESVFHGGEYDAWCRRNQIPMKLVLNFLEWNQARKVGELPWGSPIFALRWKGVELRVAVYTEPSVFWERSRGVCRSWNLMADGTCFANLETKDSLVVMADCAP